MIRLLAPVFPSGNPAVQTTDSPVVTTPESFAGQIQALIERPDATDLLGRIACPVLFMSGKLPQRTGNAHPNIT